MKKFLIVVLTFVLFGLANFAAHAQAKPETVVANLYKAGKVKSVSEMSRRELKRFFSSLNVNKILDAGKWGNGLNFDVVSSTQDTKIRDFKFG